MGMVRVNEKELESIFSDIQDIIEEVQFLRTELHELRAWKAEALRIEREWETETRAMHTELAELRRRAAEKIPMVVDHEEI